VKRAIDYAGCTDMSEVSKFLPQETQRYVPYFTAAAYIASYYEDHNLTPRNASFPLEQTRLLEVHQYASFTDIAHAAGIEIPTLVRLNPACLRGAVPRLRKGYYLVLPAGTIGTVRTFLAEKGGHGQAENIPANSFKYSHVVGSGESLEELARIFQVSVQDIMDWNDLTRPDVVLQQEIDLYLSRSFVFNRA